MHMGGGVEEGIWGGQIDQDAQARNLVHRNRCIGTQLVLSVEIYIFWNLRPFLLIISYGVEK